MIDDVLSRLQEEAERSGAIPITPMINRTVGRYLTQLHAEDVQRLLQELPNGQPAPDDIFRDWMPVAEYPNQEYVDLHWALCWELDQRVNPLKALRAAQPR